MAANVPVPNIPLFGGLGNQSFADIAHNVGALTNEYGITATASGSQSTSYLLSGGYAQIATVASGNDGLLLPPGQPGMFQWIKNDGANTLKVFGSGTDKINGTAAATGVTVANAKTAFFTFVYGYGWSGPVALA